MLGCRRGVSYLGVVMVADLGWRLSEAFQAGLLDLSALTRPRQPAAQGWNGMPEVIFVMYAGAWGRRGKCPIRADLPCSNGPRS
jgi:hypothetical protein